MYIDNKRKYNDWWIFWSTSAGVAIAMWVDNSWPIAMPEPYQSTDISWKAPFCKKAMAKWSGIIPGSECTNKLVTRRSDNRIKPRVSILSITEQIIASWCFQGYSLATVFKV